MTQPSKPTHPASAKTDSSAPTKTVDKTANPTALPPVLTVDDIATFCKRKGIIFPSSEIYGGMTGFFDYGPIGVELKNNVKGAWWKFFVQSRDDIVGIDGSIITNPKVWKASGHVDNFVDVLVEDVKTGERFRADHYVEEKLGISADGLSIDKLHELIVSNKLKSPKGNDLSKPVKFNLMFQTYVGPKISEENIAYLRAETAQHMFVQFKNVFETARGKLPLGIAQVGRSFRNEIAPRNFIFRCREFEQMEIEYFVHPDKYEGECPYIGEVLDVEVSLYTRDCHADKKDAVYTTIRDALDKKMIGTQWHAYFIGLAQKFFLELGVKPEHMRFRQHLLEELSHYSKDTWDLEYQFPWGFKELWGIADRGQYDLTQHSTHAGKEMTVFDQETNKHVVPRVIEPALGLDRTVLVFLCESLRYDEARGNNLLSLHPRLAPVKFGVFPLMKKDGLFEIAMEIHKKLQADVISQFDAAGSVGKRYARMDEIGTPFCITVDYQSKEDHTVTVRDRDSMEQKRVLIEKLLLLAPQLAAGKLTFAEL
ncbi:MAG TPA: glycine--tRNA ligase [Acidobacteriota bacterium]|nr:glycine--tRNA ligase [Acidobacteriota bacterium]